MRPQLFAIHGLWATPACFDGLAARLAADGYEMLAPALPFHDRDPALPPLAELGGVTIEDYAGFIAAEVARLPEPPVLVGHSMGAMLAQIVAARVPHRGLVLLSPAATATTMAPALSIVRTLGGVVSQWGWWKQPVRIGFEAARWGIYNGVPDDLVRREYAGLVWDSGRVMAEMGLPSLSSTKATRVDYGRLVQPALVLSGCEDRITPPAIARSTARQLQGTVDYHEIAGAGHWLFWGDIEARVARYMADWLGQFDR
jgi:pimeloyl-ACP methyl ester carboxylesterase